jgi:4-hydroxy-2-oxoheptanedioate aldolase
VETNRVRERLRAGEPTVGCFLGLGSPSVAELLGHAGFDWLLVETEHNALDAAQVEHMLMAIASTAAVPIVRVPAVDRVAIQRALDVGGMGVLVPMVRTAADVEEVVRATRYPPAGTRSFGPLRASRYGFDNRDYLDRANDNIVTAVIVETREALDGIEELVAVPGLDAVFLGLFDLCLSLGLDPLQMPLPEIDRAIERVLAAARAAGVAAGIGVASSDDLRARQEQGFTFVSYGTDYSLLAAAARAGLAAR